jgi:integrase
MPAPPSEECYTREQVHRLLATGDPMIAAALYTGMRRGELAGLRWEAVDLDRACLTVKFSFRGPPKNGKPRMVPIHRELVPILRAWQARCPNTPEGLVFPADVRGAWQMHTWPTLARVRKLLETAACPHDLDRPWHAMRRAFATLFSESGGARDALEDILGHTTSGNKITARYVLTSIAHLAREMDKLTLRPIAPAKILRLDAYRQQPAR